MQLQRIVEVNHNQVLRGLTHLLMRLLKVQVVRLMSNIVIDPIHIKDRMQTKNSPCVMLNCSLERYEHMSMSVLLFDDPKTSSYGYPRSRKNLSLVSKI